MTKPCGKHLEKKNNLEERTLCININSKMLSFTFVLKPILEIKRKNNETEFHFIEQLHCFIVEIPCFDIMASHNFFFKL